MEDLGSAEESPEMITREQRATLTKQGYAVVGTHSAVKLCRWAKTHLRGNGACYKHTFYGLRAPRAWRRRPRWRVRTAVSSAGATTAIPRVAHGAGRWILPSRFMKAWLRTSA